MRLILIAVAWVFGISLARHFGASSLALLLALLLVAALCALLLRRQQWRWILLLSVTTALGALRYSNNPQSSDIARYNGSSVTVTGQVTAEPSYRDDSVHLLVRATDIFVNSRSLVTGGQILVQAARDDEYRYGDQVRATGLLAAPASWDTFSYADYLARQNVFSIMRNAGVQVVSSGHGSPLYARLLDFKSAIIRRINSALPEPQAGLLVGILLGNEAGISSDLENDFRRTGASHIIAISGFNMVVITAIIMRVFGGLAGRNRVSATLVAIIFIVAYTILAGAGAGVVRAAMMSVLLVVGQQLRRKTFLPTSLAFATLCMSLLDPNILLDIGFQLSFCAVLGLGLFADPLARQFRALLGRHLSPPTADRLHAVLNEPVIVSIAAQIATLPLVVLYFGRVSLVAFPVNVLIVPVQSLILMIAFVAAPLSIVLPAAGAVLFWVNMVFLSWSINVVRGFSNTGFAEFVINFDSRLIQLYYLFMIGGTIVAAARPTFLYRLSGAIQKQRTLVAIVSAAAVILVLMSGMALSRSDGKLHLWLLDVGHSNAILLQSPGGVQMLVDGGRFPARLLTAIGDRLPFYDRRIEILVISHPDEWDIAALNSVLDRYSVSIVLYSGQPNHSDAFIEIKRRLAEANVPMAIVRAGHILALDDGVVLEVLHPQGPPKITDNLADHAMVMRVVFGDASILLNSDLSAAGQRDLLQHGISPQATIIQIPQHGTFRALDSRFLAAVQPQIALLQSDVANRRGDPDPDTLFALKPLIDSGRLFRTDEMGTIHLSSDGYIVQVAGEH